MPKITYIQADGTQHVVEATIGTSLMQTALNNGVAGILGDCGGACQCATCHVYIDAPWRGQLPSIGDMEDAMLDSSPAPRKDISRLACEVTVRPEFDGMVVHLPHSQL